MLKAKKGEFGYFSYERWRRFLVTLILFAIPMLILISGIIYSGSEKNILTVVAIVGLIPFSMSFVSLIMVFLHHSISKEEYDAISPHEGSLTMAYELYVTNEAHSTMVDSIAVCGNTIVGFVTDKKGDMRFTQSYIEKILRANGFHVTVNLMDNLSHYLERLDSMNAHADSLRKDIPYTPDPKYPDYSREELVWHTLLQISL